MALLGIAGFTALTAGIASNKDKTKAAQANVARTALDADGTQANQVQGGANPNPTSPKKKQGDPEWSDLVVWADGNDIDITRLQMLVFAVLAAGFVALKICDDNAFPTIPDGIILLMGLANGVYVGGRFVFAVAEALSCREIAYGSKRTLIF